MTGSQDSSPAPLFKSVNSLALNLFYSSTLLSIHDYETHTTINMNLLLRGIAADVSQKTNIEEKKPDTGKISFYLQNEELTKLV